MRNALASVINIFYKKLDRKKPNFGNKTTVVKSVSGWSIQRVIFFKLGYDYSILAKNGLFNTEYDGENAKTWLEKCIFTQTDAENSIYSHNIYQVLYHIFS